MADRRGTYLGLVAQIGKAARPAQDIGKGGRSWVVSHNLFGLDNLGFLRHRWRLLHVWCRSILSAADGGRDSHCALVRHTSNGWRCRPQTGRRGRGWKKKEECSGQDFCRHACCRPRWYYCHRPSSALPRPPSSLRTSHCCADLARRPDL